MTEPRRVYIYRDERWPDYGIWNDEYDDANATLTDDEYRQVQEAEAAYEAAQEILEAALARGIDEVPGD